MPTIRLTEAALRKAIAEAAATGARPEITDAATAGLRFRPHRDGRRGVWSLMVRDQTGRNRRVGLGEFPAIGIADARAAAEKARHRIRYEGADPTAEKRAAREKAKAEAEQPAGGMTLANLVERWGRQTGADQARAWPDRKRRIASVFSRLLDRPAMSITRVELQVAADEWPSPSSASSAIRYIRPVLTWAEDREYVQSRTSAVKQPRPPVRRDRFLSVEELGRLLPYLRANAGTSPHAAVMLFILWTATRLDEAAEAKWGEFSPAGDPAIWTIPAERIKRTKETQLPRPHVLALPRQVTAFLLARRPEAVRPDQLAFPNRNGVVASNWDKMTKKIQEATGTAGWTRHDLRRTAATWMGEMGTDPHVIEAALNHADIHSRLAGTYNRSRYSAEVGEALQRWADRMDEIGREG